MDRTRTAKTSTTVCTLLQTPVSTTALTGTASVPYLVHNLQSAGQGDSSS